MLQVLELFLKCLLDLSDDDWSDLGIVECPD